MDANEPPHAGRESGSRFFPFIPYAIQSQLMNKIIGTIQQEGVGIFESPTGTVSEMTALYGTVN